MTAAHRPSRPRRRAPARLTRRAPFLLVFLSILAACPAAALFPAGCRRAPAKPNILLITLDTTRRDHLSCYGYGRKTSPNLDALAAEGIRFDDCLSVSSWTLPSHASLFTGLYPSTHGAHYDEKAKLSLTAALGDSSLARQFHAHGLGNEAVTLAEVLAEAGYATGGVAGGPWLKRPFGLSQGFACYDDAVESVGGRPAREITDLAIPFVRRNAGHPFFLFLNYFDPHFPYEPPGRYASAFRGAAEEAGDGDRAERVALYDGEILYMDRYIGLVFDELKRLGLWDRTWIIVTADHGEHFGEKGIKGHGYALYEGTLRVPLIMKLPQGFNPPGDPAARSQIVQIMPTVLERLGITPPGPFDVPPLGEGGGEAAAELFKNRGNVALKGERFDRNLTAFYKDRYKLIRSTRPKDPDAGLFDLARDPAEEHDLTAARPGLAAGLAKALARWRRSLRPPLAPLTIEGVKEATRKQLKALGY